MPSLDVIRADPQPEVRRGIFGTLRNDIIAAVGEFIGTIVFLLFALGATQTVVQPPTDSTGGGTDLSYQVITQFYISAAFGFGLYASASIFYRFTGSIFNPSVGLALWMSGVIGIVRFVHEPLLTAFAQMLGGIVASALVLGLTPNSLGVNNRLSPGVSRGRGLFLEAFGTAALTLSVLMLAAELYTVPLTGGAINTARAFGPDVVAGDFPSYHWIYWLGPTLGAVLATAFYYLLKTIGYWRINPGQDTQDVRESALPDLHLSRSSGSQRAASPISFVSAGSPRFANSAGTAGTIASTDSIAGRVRGNSHPTPIAERMSRVSDATYSSRNQRYATPTSGPHPRSPTVQDGEKLGRPVGSPVGIWKGVTPRITRTPEDERSHFPYDRAEIKGAIRGMTMNDLAGQEDGLA